MNDVRRIEISICSILRRLYGWAQVTCSGWLAYKTKLWQIGQLHRTHLQVVRECTRIRTRAGADVSRCGRTWDLGTTG